MFRNVCLAEYSRKLTSLGLQVRAHSDQGTGPQEVRLLRRRNTFLRHCTCRKKTRGQTSREHYPLSARCALTINGL